MLNMTIQPPPSNSPPNPPFELLNLHYNPLTSEAHLRIFLPSQNTIRYIHIDPHIYDSTLFTPPFLPLLPYLLPSLPPPTIGAWNRAHISKNHSSGFIHFSQADEAHLERVSTIWHPVRIEFVELVPSGKVYRSNIYEVSHPLLRRPAVVKFARFEWEVKGVERETVVYKELFEKVHRDSFARGFGLGFWGHVVEGGRGIGLLLERMDDCRDAEIGDLEACRKALKEIHDIGFLHGSLGRDKFRVREGKVVVIGLGKSVKCDDEEVLEEEMEGLEAMLIEDVRVEEKLMDSVETLHDD